MTIMQKGIPVRWAALAVILAAAPALGQNINIDVGSVFGTPTAAYGAGAGQIGVWNTVNGALATPQALTDINGAPVAATFQINAGNFDFNFNNAGTAGDDQALMDDGADLGTTDVDTITIANLDVGNYSVYTYAWAPDNATFITVVDVNGLGTQNVGGIWPGAQTEGITYSLHSNVVTAAGGSITITLTQGVSFKTLNGIQLVAGANDQGRCCDPAGDCAITTEEACNAPNVFGGLGTNCVGLPCRGRCCHPNGFCEITGPGDCVTPAVFGGLGSNCTGDPCSGRCCDNDGNCQLTGPANCVAPAVFGGLGTNCNNSPCMGRCCTAGNCTVAPVITCAGTATPGLLNCDAVQVFQFDNVNMIIFDNPAGTTSSNVQTIETSGTVIITDLDVDMNAVHTWPGDVAITIEHLGTAVTIYDRPGVPASTFGCATDNFNIILDDEGAGGPIETVCNAAPPSALSPPNFTPANPLSAFDGLAAAGDWTITTTDFFFGDSGTLLSWSLHISSDSAVCPAVGCTCFGDMNGDTTVNGVDIPLFATCVAAGGASCPCGDMDHAGGATSSDVTAFVTAVLTSTCGTP